MFLWVIVAILAEVIGQKRSKERKILMTFFRLGEDVFKPSVEVGVKRIGADWRVGGFVAPLFVAPEPQFGVL